jgi:hypothetical protein
MNMRQTDGCITRRLPFARLRHTLGDFAAALGRRWQDEIGGRHRRHLDMKVDAIEQRA